MKLLLVSFHGLWPDYIENETLIALHLKNEGHDVSVLTCDKFFETCNLHISFDQALEQDREETCRNCRASQEYFHSFLKANDVKILKLSQIASLCSPLSLGKDEQTAEYCKHTIENARLSNGFNYTAQANAYRMSPTSLENINANNPSSKYSRQLRNLKRYSAYTYLVLKYYFESSNIECLISNHAHRTLMSSITKSARDSDVRHIVFGDLGPRVAANHIVIFDYPSERIFIDTSIQAPCLYKPKLSLPHAIPPAITQIKGYFSQLQSSFSVSFDDRLQYSELGKGKTTADFVLAQYSERDALRNSICDHQLTDEILRYLLAKFGQTKQVVILFTSTPCEDLATYCNPESDYQVAIIKAIFRVARKYPDHLFIIRDHPNRYTSKDFKFPEPSYFVEQCLLAETSDFPDNILVFPSFVRIDAFSLISICRICICPISSLALESFLLGKYTLTIDHSYYARFADNLIGVTRLSGSALLESCQDALEEALQCDTSEIETRADNMVSSRASFLIDWLSTVYVDGVLVDAKSMRIKGTQYCLSDFVRTNAVIDEITCLSKEDLQSHLSNIENSLPESHLATTKLIRDVCKTSEKYAATLVSLNCSGCTDENGKWRMTSEIEWIYESIISRISALTSSSFANTLEGKFKGLLNKSSMILLCNAIAGASSPIPGLILFDFVPLDSDRLCHGYKPSSSIEDLLGRISVELETERVVSLMAVLCLSAINTDFIERLVLDPRLVEHEEAILSEAVLSSLPMWGLLRA